MMTVQGSHAISDSGKRALRTEARGSLIGVGPVVMSLIGLDYTLLKSPLAALDSIRIYQWVL